VRTIPGDGAGSGEGVDVDLDIVEVPGFSELRSKFRRALEEAAEHALYYQVAVAKGDEAKQQEAAARWNTATMKVNSAAVALAQLQLSAVASAQIQAHMNDQLRHQQAQMDMGPLGMNVGGVAIPGAIGEQPQMPEMGMGLANLTWLGGMGLGMGIGGPGHAGAGSASSGDHTAYL
jgi:hypothetical protein